MMLNDQRPLVRLKNKLMAMVLLRGWSCDWIVVFMLAYCAAWTILMCIVV